jgi:hypothetical protein
MWLVSYSVFFDRILRMTISISFFLKIFFGRSSLEQILCNWKKKPTTIYNMLKPDTAHSLSRVIVPATLHLYLCQRLEFIFFIPCVIIFFMIDKS